MKIGRRRLVHVALLALVLAWLLHAYKRANELTLTIVNQTGGAIRNVEIVDIPDAFTHEVVGRAASLDAGAQESLTIRPFSRIEVSFVGPDSKEHWMALHRPNWKALRYGFRLVLKEEKAPQALIDSNSLWPLWEDRRWELRYNVFDMEPPSARHVVRRH